MGGANDWIYGTEAWLGQWGIGRDEETFDGAAQQSDVRSYPVKTHFNSICKVLVSIFCYQKSYFRLCFEYSSERLTNTRPAIVQAL